MTVYENPILLIRVIVGLGSIPSDSDSRWVKSKTNTTDYFTDGLKWIVKMYQNRWEYGIHKDLGQYGKFMDFVLNDHLFLH